MNPTILRAEPVCDHLKALAQGQIEKCMELNGRPPSLAVILVGEDPASKVYVGHKAKVAAKWGIHSVLIKRPDHEDQASLIRLIEQLNADDKTDAILVQLPLPKHLDSEAVLNTIAPEKDADQLHPVSLGNLLVAKSPKLAPCTPAGVIELLDFFKFDLKGKVSLVLGRSRIVGLPLSQLLLKRDSTVIVAHSKSQNIADLANQADFVFAAAGVSRGIDFAELNPKGCVLIDIGIHRLPGGGLCGDFSERTLANPNVLAYSPVPGGVGPLTIAKLMENTVTLALNRTSSI